MAAPVGRGAWQELLDRFVAQRRRLADHDEFSPLTLPEPGATEEQLCAAEARLGHPLDPHYREFLSVANGWDEYFISSSLLGTEDIGTGSRWARVLEHLGFAFGEAEIAGDLGVPNDLTNCQPIGDGTGGYHDHLAMFIRDAPGCCAGSVFSIDTDMDMDASSIRPNLYLFLTEELPAVTEFADRAALGPHSDPWGRDIRIAPPSMAEIVAEIVRLAEIARNTDTGWRDQPTVVNPGATPAELDALEHDLGIRLHPEHRELLAITDGMSVQSWEFHEILSVDELRNGGRWHETISRTQEYEDSGFRAQLENHRRGMASAPEPSALVAVRSTIIPATPFAVGGLTLYGVDTRDGNVRNLLRDGEFPRPAGDTSPTFTIREYLLTQCDAVWWRAGRSAPGQMV